MKLIEVQSSRHEKEFIQVGVKLYKKHPYWIRPLDKDIRSIFDPSKNPLAKKEASFRKWILKDSGGQLIGRIAAFEYPQSFKKDQDYSLGGIGLFECIDDQNAANLLFDTAKEWLEAKGLEAMEGPINYGERDKFWGLLTEGFKLEPNYLANYNFPYYKTLFETYGFKVWFNQFSFTRPVKANLDESYIEKAKNVIDQPEFVFKHIKKKQLAKFTEDFRTIYNKAWTKLLGVSEMSKEKATALINSMKPVIDEKTAWFAYYKNEPIGFFIMIPEVNQLFKYVNGKLNLWGKLKFAYYRMLQKNTKLMGIIFGVIPEFDRKGVTNAITYSAQKALTDYKNYQKVELAWIGDFNPAMLKFISKLNSLERCKVHTTYRYLFDRERPYQRMPLKKKTENIN